MFFGGVKTALLVTFRYCGLPLKVESGEEMLSDFLTIQLIFDGVLGKYKWLQWSSCSLADFSTTLLKSFV